jgi:hypothetical protein
MLALGGPGWNFVEQHDYEQRQFSDDCFKINAIPLRAGHFVSTLGKPFDELLSGSPAFH